MNYRLMFVIFSALTLVSVFSAQAQRFPDMIKVDGGTFMMGLEEKLEDADSISVPLHSVTVKTFHIAKTEITVAQWRAFCNAVDRQMPNPPSWGWIDNHPIVNISWDDAIAYCKWLSDSTHKTYRLPTEAEWEYACRAGTTTAYFFGNDKSKLSEYAWDLESGDDKYEKVGQKKANPWGLYDILGNLMEWTLDHYDPERYAKIDENAKNPVTEVNSSKYPKVLRGGSFMESGAAFRSAKRFHSEPAWNRRDPQIPKSKWWLTEAKNVGIRLVRPQLQPSADAINEFFKNYLGL